MRQNVNKPTDGHGAPAGVFVRAFVVFASLLSLCVSDGTGPRLVPFPTRPAEERADPAGESRRPGARVETRAASGHQPKAVTPVWNNAALGRAALSPPPARPAAPPDLYTSRGYSFGSTSLTRGRAPPPQLPTA